MGPRLSSLILLFLLAGCAAPPVQPKLLQAAPPAPSAFYCVIVDDPFTRWVSVCSRIPVPKFLIEWSTDLKTWHWAGEWRQDFPQPVMIPAPEWPDANLLRVYQITPRDREQVLLYRVTPL